MTAEERLSKQIRDFLWTSHLCLVLRGYERERDIRDPILRNVWRFGLQIQKGKKK